MAASGRAVSFDADVSTADVSELDVSASLKQRNATNAAAPASGGGRQRTDSFASEQHRMTRSKSLASLNKQTETTIAHDVTTRVIFPWSTGYRCWWGWTVFCSVFTIFFETYQVAFGPGGLTPYNDASSIIEFFLLGVFLLDSGVTFNLAYYDQNDDVVCNRVAIAKRYLRKMFWVDLVGIFPFYYIALSAAGAFGQDTNLTQYLGLLRLFKLVRVYRVKQLLDMTNSNTAISLMTLTLLRNLAVAIIWTHTAACVMFFIARQYDFDEDNTWLGSKVYDLNGFERYCTALYWSVVTFTTVGYGDFSPANSAEQIWGMIYMLINMVVAAWIIGSITLLIVKNDEKTGLYRDALETLAEYASIHNFDKPFYKRLKNQLKLDFTNREVSDEQVLQYLPNSMRRKVLRRLYLPSLNKTNLMKGIRQQFIDEFLTTCSVEIFTPGQEILQRGSTASDLYLLVGGTIEVGAALDDSNHSSTGRAGRRIEREAGEFINEVGFFTESPEIDTVRTVTLCKTLTISNSAYKTIAQEHPGSAGRVLQNLLDSVEKIAEDMGEDPSASLPKKIEMLRAGSHFYSEGDDNRGPPPQASERSLVLEQKETQQFIALRDLVKMHISKQKDDHTTKFLFAASRGDINTISLMCDQGFDPDNADYDQRTALMVAAMLGNTDVVTKLLDYGADPNLTDMHGSSALYEAARKGHELTMDELLKHGAELCMTESLAASVLCQAVYDGDVPLLSRLLKAKVQVNAADYDKRTAAHIAAAEGNVAALKTLIEADADLTLKDRWGNTVDAEAKSSKATHVTEYLKEQRKSQSKG
eukprot:CAMPEP_0178627300 /NCGR_PEP_ID=MMETSP0698-20121128/8842_1 /TAXON_ID=265572 /ORGANISM="Extubocellulus spinifer, Strain CCMP396" /LENGTH=811 /DNA_ID=CAMNT_0020266529 /DNA_START=46 /DNA_END=2481 /DNA_ORIENTATION=+